MESICQRPVSKAFAFYLVRQARHRCCHPIPICTPRCCSNYIVHSISTTSYKKSSGVGRLITSHPESASNQQILSDQESILTLKGLVVRLAAQCHHSERSRRSLCGARCRPGSPRQCSAPISVQWCPKKLRSDRCNQYPTLRRICS